MDAEPSDNPLPARNDPVPGKEPPADTDHPKALRESVALIERLLAEGGDPAAGIRELCERATANPATLVAPAGRWLARLLADGRLETCPDVPAAYLVEELIQGSMVILPLKMAQWEARDEISPQIKLAEKLADRAGRLKDCGPDASGVILRIARKIAIQKPMRCGRLIEIASPMVSGRPDQSTLADAQKWQAAGEFLAGEGREHRQFWQSVMNQPLAVDWADPAAIRAVSFLKRAPDKEGGIPPILIEQMPPAVWTPVSLPGPEKAGDAPASEAVPAAQEVEAEVRTHHGQEPETAPPKPEDAVRPKRRSGFFSGFMIGGLTMFLGALWLWRDFILQPPASETKPPESPRLVPAPTTGETPPNVELPVTETSPAPAKPAAPPAASPPAPAPASTGPAPAAPSPPAAAVVMATEEKPAVTKPETPPAAAPPAEAPAKAAPPPVASEPSPPPPPMTDKSPEAWRKAEFAALAARHPSLMRWHATVRTAKWHEAGPYVQGTKSYLPYTSEDFVPFLKLLLLDPPTDPEVAQAVPKLAARRLKTAELLPLWERLVYPGSPNEKPIKAAARVYFDMKKDVLGPDALEQLTKITAP